MPRHPIRFLLVPLFLTGLAACGVEPAAPAPLAGDADALIAWGPETPPLNLEVRLLDVHGGSGFGLVKFRQPNDEVTVVELGTWVRGLAPNTEYFLERAVDLTIDDDCSSTTWLTLGEGVAVVPIVTDDDGTGRADLWRAVPPTPGATFDIHFRVRDAGGTVVLQSDCYQYTVSL